MQPLQNSELRKLPSEKGKGLAGTIIIHLVLFVLLILVSFSFPPPPEAEEGILVNFGTDETGLGMVEPSPPAVVKETSPPPPSNVAKNADEEPLLTQNDEEAPEVKKIDPEAEKKRIEKIEADKKKREELEAERVRKKKEDDVSGVPDPGLLIIIPLHSPFRLWSCRRGDGQNLYARRT